MAKLKLYPTVKEELQEGDFFKEYKEEVSANKGKEVSDEEALCELIYDLIKEMAGVVA